MASGSKIRYARLEVGWETRIAHCTEPAVWRVYPWIRANPHANTEGLFALPKMAIVIACRIDLEACDRALHFLQDEGLIDYDHEREVVFDRLAIRIQAPVSATQIEGSMRKLRQVTSATPLWQSFWEECAVHAPGLAEAIAREIPKGEGIGDPIGGGIGDPMGDPMKHRVSGAASTSSEYEKEQGPRDLGDWGAAAEVAADA